MPTRNVHLTDELDRFVAEKVQSGLYADASDVMRAALRRLEQEDRESELKLTVLREAIAAGLESGLAEPSSFDRIRARHNLPPRVA